MENDTDCRLRGLLGDRRFLILDSLPTSFISVLICLATAALVCKQRLYKTLVYRLAMYQVLSAMEFSIIWIIAAISIPFYNYEVTIVLETVLMGSSLVKLMFTVWISLHLFALAVFHKNLQRLERLYVVSSLLIPLAVTTVLLGINLTLHVHVLHCYSTNLKEQIIYVIIFAALVLLSLLMVVMGLILCHRACRRRNTLLSEYDKQHKKALCEMLPLLLYPIFFLLFTMPICRFAVSDLVTSFRALDHLTTQHQSYGHLFGLGYLPPFGASLHLCCSFLTFVLSGASVKKRFYNLEI